MQKKSALHWLATSITFLVATIVVFLPMLFLLVSTPLHDGDELPGPLLLFSTALASTIVGVAAAWLAHRLLRAWAAKGAGRVEA